MLKRYFCREYFIKTILCVIIMEIAVGFLRFTDFGIDLVASL